MVYDTTYNPYGDNQFNTVADYQKWLQGKGFNLGKSGADGKWGKQSQTAFNQAAYGPNQVLNKSAGLAGNVSNNYQPYTRASHTTQGGFGGIGTKTDKGYSYASPVETAIVDTSNFGGVGDYGMYNGVGLDKEAFNAIKDSGVTEGLYRGVGQSDGLAGMWDSIGGTKGLADIAGAVGALGSLYMGIQQNKLAKEELGMRRDEINRQKQRDVDFANAVNKSGLGSYSAGVK